MDRKLASIRRISDIVPIEGADLIELAKIDGWQVVIAKKDDFTINDLCVYCEIDSILPERSEFEFLRDKKFRIKTIKLKGQLSQGICFPLTILQNFVYTLHENGFAIGSKTGTSGLNFIAFEEGLDVTELMQVTKYEPPIPTHLEGMMRGNFPSCIVKSDEERCQNLVDKFDSWKNIQFVCTEKLDGTSETFSLINDEFHVCSRNIDLKDEGDNTYWKVAKELGIELKMRHFCLENGYKNLAIQGELVGEGIQGNKYKLKKHNLFLFNVFDIDKQEYFDWTEFQYFVRISGLNQCPIIGESFMLADISIDKLLELADGVSRLNPEVKREGIVFKSFYKIPNVPFKKVSFKVISNKFLLKHGE